jgi:hypothetical protein
MDVTSRLDGLLVKFVFLSYPGDHFESRHFGERSGGSRRLPSSYTDCNITFEIRAFSGGREFLSSRT